jgi:histidine triad (HIT) family protein
MSCLFCKMVNGEITPDVVFEDDALIAFRDINPQAPTHVLIITRQHFTDAVSASRTDSGIMDEIAREAHEVATSEGVTETGYRVVFNTGAGAGQTVFHLHGHVLGGRGLEWPPG